MKAFEILKKRREISKKEKAKIIDSWSHEM